jgi:predicted short-subunit dehydrogenase-like oxidoreductase (DUF2520 family)
MTFSIIGTGNIAWFFGNRLVSGRHRCVGVYARDVVKAQELSEALLSDKFGAINDINDDEADVCFMAVSDAAVAEIAKMISLEKTVLIHTAGAVSIDAIKPAATERAVFWPVYSILKSNFPDHRNIPCAWEASSDKAKRILLNIGHAITDELFEAKYDQRKWLHLSAVIGNNFINHLLGICEQICTENELPATALQPIINQTFERAKQASPLLLQTGPAVRHDSVTIESQLALLQKHPQWQKVYEAITNSIQSK